MFTSSRSEPHTFSVQTTPTMYQGHRGASEPSIGAAPVGSTAAPSLPTHVAPRTGHRQGASAGIGLESSNSRRSPAPSSPLPSRFSPLHGRNESAEGQEALPPPLPSKEGSAAAPKEGRGIVDVLFVSRKRSLKTNDVKQTEKEAKGKSAHIDQVPKDTKTCTSSPTNEGDVDATKRGNTMRFKNNDKESGEVLLKETKTVVQEPLLPTKRGLSHTSPLTTNSTHNPVPPSTGNGTVGSTKAVSPPDRTPPHLSSLTSSTERFTVGKRDLVSSSALHGKKEMNTSTTTVGRLDTQKLTTSDGTTSTATVSPASCPSHNAEDSRLDEDTREPTSSLSSSDCSVSSRNSKSSQTHAKNKSGEGNLLRRMFRVATKNILSVTPSLSTRQSMTDKAPIARGVSNTAYTPPGCDTGKPIVSPPSFSTYPPLGGRTHHLAPASDDTSATISAHTLPALLPDRNTRPTPPSLPTVSSTVPSSFPYALSPTSASSRKGTSVTPLSAISTKNVYSPTPPRKQSFMEVDVEEGEGWRNDGQGSTGGSEGVPHHLPRSEKKSETEAGHESTREDGNYNASYHTMIPGWSWVAPNRSAPSPPSFCSSITTTNTMTNSKLRTTVGGKWTETGEGGTTAEEEENGDGEEDVFRDGETGVDESRMSSVHKPPLLRRLYSPSRSLGPEEEMLYSSPLTHSPNRTLSNSNSNSASLSHLRRNPKTDMRDSWQRRKGNEMEEHPDTMESEYASEGKMVLQHTLSHSGGRRLPQANDSGGSPKKETLDSTAGRHLSTVHAASPLDPVPDATDGHRTRDETHAQAGGRTTTALHPNDKERGKGGVTVTGGPNRTSASPAQMTGNTAKNDVESSTESGVEEGVGQGSRTQRSSPTFHRRCLTSTSSSPSSSSSNSNSSGTDKCAALPHSHVEALHSTKEEEVQKKKPMDGKKSNERSASSHKWTSWKVKPAAVEDGGSSLREDQHNKKSKDTTTGASRTTLVADRHTAPPSPSEGSHRARPSAVSVKSNGLLSISTSDSQWTPSSQPEPGSTALDAAGEHSHNSSVVEGGILVKKMSSLGSNPNFFLSTFDLPPHPVGGVKKQRNPEEDLLSDISSIDTASLHSSTALLSPTAVSRSNGRSALTYLTNNRDVLNEIEQERNRPPLTIEEEIFVYDDIVIRKDDAKTKHWRLAGRKSLFETPTVGHRGSSAFDAGRSSGSATPSAEVPTTFSFNDFDICVDEMDISFGALPSDNDGPGKAFGGGDSVLSSTSLGRGNGGGLLPVFGLGTEEEEVGGGGGFGFHSLLEDRAEGPAETRAEEGGGDEGAKGVLSRRSSRPTSNGGVIRGNTSLVIRDDMVVTWTQTPLSQHRRMEEVVLPPMDAVRSVNKDGWEQVTDKGSGGSDNSSRASSQGKSSQGGPISTNGVVPKKIHNFHVQKLLGHPTRVKCLSISPTEKEFVSCSNEDASVMLYSFAVGSEVGIFTSHEETVICTAFSPDGKLLATSSKDRSMKLWDVMTTKLLLTYNHSKVVICCCFSPDSRYVVSGCQDRVCRLWDTRRGKEWIAYTQHEGIIISVCFSPDSQFVCSSSADCTLRVWTSMAAKTKYTLTGHKGIILSCNYTTDGAYIVSNDESQLRVWSTADGSCQLMLSPERVAGSPSFRTPFGDQRVGWTLSAAGPGQFTNCIIVACNNRFVYVLDRNTGEEVLSYFCKAPVYCLSSGWKKLVSFGDNLGNIYMLNLS